MKGKGERECGGIRRGKTECSRPFKIYYSLRECIFEILSIFFFSCRQRNVFNEF